MKQSAELATEIVSEAASTIYDSATDPAKEIGDLWVALAERIETYLDSIGDGDD